MEETLKTEDNNNNANNTIQQNEEKETVLELGKRKLEEISESITSEQNKSEEEESTDSDSEVSSNPRKKWVRKVTIKTIDELVKFLNDDSKFKMRNVLVLAGAGISVNSGIPDFRSSNGVYAQIEALQKSTEKEKSTLFKELPYAEALFELFWFKENPRPFYEFFKEFANKQQNSHPTPTHHFLKLLEDKGRLMRIYTQNIDDLEHKVGIERVVQCHGSLSTLTCISCNAKFEIAKFMDDIKNSKLPMCNRCKKESVLKPNITFFGEEIKSDITSSISSDKTKVHLLIVIGSSLKVAPMNDIMNFLPKHIPRILINRESLNTKWKFDLQLLGDCDSICHYLNEKLNWSGKAFQESREIEVKSVKSGVYTFDEILKPEPVDEDLIEYEEFTCNKCKKKIEENPRYVCTKCFNFDLCKDCYRAKKHTRHPMLEKWDK